MVKSAAILQNLNTQRNPDMVDQRMDLGEQLDHDTESRELLRNRLSQLDKQIGQPINIGSLFGTMTSRSPTKEQAYTRLSAHMNKQHGTAVATDRRLGLAA